MVDQRDVDAHDAPSEGNDDTLVLRDDGSAPPIDRAEARFKPGDTLDSRYKVVRLIGRGGMGEVYEADDLELGEAIAIKLIQRDLATDEPSMVRFRREIQLSRRVTHPNICRVFDLHIDSSGADPLSFVTMELLDGRTLGHYLRAQGPPDLTDATRVIREICSGLAAAHRLGVIHRDLKSENVVLARRADGSQRAVITDFGLARRVTEAAGDEFRTTPGILVGTLAYMAPEQFRGEPASVATDIYALGLVIYETLTGAHPFKGSSLVATMRRIQEDPPPPRLSNPSIPAVLSAIVMRCLDRTPSKRFRSVDEIISALDADSAAPMSSTPSLPGRRSAILVAAFILAAAAAGLWIASRTPPPATPLAAARPIRSVAVAVTGFRNLSRDPAFDWMSTALADMLATEISEAGGARIIAPEQVARVLDERRLGGMDAPFDRVLTAVRENLGATRVVSGSFLRDPAGSGRVRVDVRLIDAATGDTIAADAIEGTDAELLDLVTRSGSVLRSRLGGSPLNTEQTVRLAAARPANDRALRLYAEGLDRLRAWDPLAARDRLREAVAADPEFARAHEALAIAFGRLAFDKDALAEASRAHELAGRLGERDRLSIAARYFEMARKWDEAIAASEQLVRLQPDDVELRKQLAQMQSNGGKPKNALETLAGIPREGLPTRDLGSIELTEANVKLAAADYPGALAAAKRAQKKAQESGASLLWANALSVEGNALQRIGRLDDANEPFRRSLEVFRSFGDVGGEAMTINRMGSLAFSRGDYAAARTYYRQSREMGKKLGNRRAEALGVVNQSVLEMKDGNLDESMRLCLASRPIFEEIQNKVFLAGTWDNIGYLQYLAGNLRQSRSDLERALEIAKTSGSAHMEAVALYNLGDTLAALGEADGGLARHREALAIREKAGEKRETLDSRVAIAAIDLDEGRIDEALRAAGEASAAAREGKFIEAELRAHLVAARALRSRGKLESAKVELAAADALATSAGKVERSMLAIELAALRGAEAATRGDGATRAETAATAAASMGTKLLELDALLVRATILRTDPASRREGKRALATVERQAASIGYRQLIARSARIRVP
ncbi:MAG: protein kinase [Thermoanaerobaculia bacterium]|jgi:tetratricopeptide (TPR) repeat protein/TolB-like protein